MHIHDYIHVYVYTHEYIHICMYVYIQKETHRNLNAPGAAGQKMLHIATSLRLLQLLHLFRV